MIMGNQLTILCVAGKKCSLLLPNVPKLEIQGNPNLEVEDWWAMFAPAGTPEAVIQLSNKGFVVV